MSTFFYSWPSGHGRPNTTSSPRNNWFTLSAVICFFAASSLFAQTPTATLCEQNANLIGETRIGAGTAMNQSSKIGSSISGVVLITGNFEVNASFSFVNAQVKVMPGVRISVICSAASAHTGVTLSLDNSQFFACDGMWEGIELGALASIITNNTQVEDAETAIKAHQFSALYLQNTVFNRNKTGLDLFTNPNSMALAGPSVWVFANNQFTCTAPLNSGPTEYSDVGVRLKNTYLFAYQSGQNTFSNLNYGIYAEGLYNAIGGQQLRMKQIRKEGIYLESGIIDLENCQFADIFETAIHVNTAQYLDLRNTTFDYHMDVLPWDEWNYRTGIMVEKFAPNARVDVADMVLTADMQGTKNRIRGIHLKGGNVGAGTQIAIWGNHNQQSSRFAIRSTNAQGIFLDGFFPFTTTTRIEGVAFQISTVSGSTSRPEGILADYGDKNNLSILGNSFTAFAPSLLSQWSTGLHLKNSAGTNNAVKNNFFNDDIDNLLQYVIVEAFQNTHFCSNNTSGLGGWSYEFKGICTGTIFENNRITGTGYGLVIRPGAVIGQQKHMGNEWYNIPLPAPYIAYSCVQHVWCEGDPLANQFVVHTNQSTCSTDPACVNPFFPEHVLSDSNSLFFTVDLAGKPSAGCLDGLQDSTETNRGLAGFRAVNARYLAAWAIPATQRSTQTAEELAAMVQQMRTNTRVSNNAETSQRRAQMQQLWQHQTALNTEKAAWESLVLAQLEEAWEANENTAATTTEAEQEKTVHRAQLEALLHHNGNLSPEHRRAVVAIAAGNGPAAQKALQILEASERPEREVVHTVTEQVYAVAVERAEPMAAAPTAFTLAPNPATDQFSVLDPGGNGVRITVTDIAGKTWISAPVTGETTVVQRTGSMPAGYYIVRMEQRDGRFSTQKLMVSDRL
jgi:hypothetical protein